MHPRFGKDFPKRAVRTCPAPWPEATLVFFSAFLVHLRSIAFDFVGVDDQDFLVEDHDFLVRHVNLLRIFTRAYMHVVDAQHAYYRPIVTVSYMLDAHWSGVRPLGYHATNVVLHALASLLFFALLRRFALGHAAVLGGLLFALHPALAANAAWIPGRNDSLLAIFVISAWLPLAAERGPPSWLMRLGHGTLFGLALLTKESALAAPVVWTLHLAVLDPTLPRATRRQRFRGFAPFWALLVAARLLLRPLGIGTTLGELTRQGFAETSLVVKAFGALVFPVNPSLLAAPKDLPAWPGVLAVALAAAATSFLPGVRRRVVALGAAAFALFLAPGLAAGTALVLSSRLYLPACGVILGAAEIIRALGVLFEPRVVASFSAVTLVALAFLTAGYESTFHDRRSFAKAEVEAAPHCGLAHFCLGQTFQIDGQPDRALAEYRLALSLGSREVVHNNLAVLYMARSDWVDAESELRSELATSPRYGRAYRNLAVVLRQQGRIDEARAAAARAGELESETAP